MKKKALVIGALLPLMCLASCKGEVFNYKKLDLSKDYVLYKHMYAVSESYNISYKTLLRFSNINEVIETVEWGEDILLLFYGEDCHSCQESIPNLINDISYLRLSIFVINTNTSESASALNRYIAEKGIQKVTSNVINGGTPSLYLLNNKKVTEVFYGSKGDKTTDVVIKALKEYTTCCGLEYCLADLGICEKPNVPTYILDRNKPGSTGFYYESIFPLAKKSQKSFQVLDVTSIQDNLKGIVLDSFGNNLYDSSGWGLDSFDGWIVSLDTFAGPNGSVGRKIDRHNYLDSATKVWLEDYFKN